MQITILSVNKQSAVTKTGKGYSLLEVAYKNPEGKVMGKKIMPFGDSRAIFDALQGASSGDSYDITTAKQGEYWVWTNVKKSDGSVTLTPVNSTKSGKVTGSNYETPEERARRQVMIVRQSSISSAVTLKPKATVEEIIDTAKQFEQYVLSTGELPAAEHIVLEDDVI